MTMNESIAAAADALGIRLPSRRELIADGVVHVVGIALGVIGAAVLIVIAAMKHSYVEVVAVSIYAAGMIAMFSLSALYNIARKSRYREYFQRLDHSGIFLMIAGTYTAFTMLMLKGDWAIYLMAIVWSVASLGILIKLLWPKRLQGVTTGLYIALGWVGIIAIEPVENMRRRLEDLAPAVTVMDGVAESIPAGEATADVVLAAQAFHWFDGRRALVEIARVLRPGGRFGLIWNARDESSEWVARMAEIVDRHGSGVPQYKFMEWKRAFEACRVFMPLAERSFRHAQTGDLQMILDRVASISFVAALPPSDRRTVLGEVTRLIRSHPQTRGMSHITLPYRTDVYWARKT